MITELWVTLAYKAHFGSIPLSTYAVSQVLSGRVIDLKLQNYEVANIVLDSSGF